MFSDIEKCSLFSTEENNRLRSVQMKGEEEMENKTTVV